MAAVPEPKFAEVMDWIMHGGELGVRRAEKALSSTNAFPMDGYLTQYLWGLIHAHRNRVEQSVEAFRAAVELSEWRHKASINNFGTMLLRAGRQPEALTVWEHALRLHPDESHFFIGKAVTLAGNQEYDSALTFLDQASENLGKSDYVHTLADGTRLAERHRQLAVILFLKGVFSVASGGPEIAVTLLRQSIAAYLGREVPVRMTEMSDDYLETVMRFIVDIDKDLSLHNFTLCLRQLDTSDEAAQEAFPLFTLDAWIGKLSATHHDECRTALREATERARQSGDWRQAVRLAENWYETALLRNNAEFMKRVGPMLGSDAPPDLSRAMSHQDFIALLRDHTS